MKLIDEIKFALQARKVWKEIRKSKMDWTITIKKFFRELGLGAVSVLGAALLGYLTPETLTQAAHNAGVPDSVILLAVPIVRSGLEVLRNWLKHR